jgi:hypothetical protein
MKAKSDAKIKKLQDKTKQFSKTKGTFSYDNYTLEVQPQGFIEEFWTK